MIGTDTDRASVHAMHVTTRESAAGPGRGPRPSARTIAAGALLAVLHTSTPAGADPLPDVVSRWNFGQSEGPVLNMAHRDGAARSSEPGRNDGSVGYSRDRADDAAVNRDGRRAVFTGARDSIVFIDDTTHSDFNPGSGSLRAHARFTVDRSALSDEALGPNQTWNLVQKGRFNNAGGQWKLQVRKNFSGRIFFQCLVNDDNPGTRRQFTEVAIETAWILDDRVLEGRCTLDRQAAELRAELTDASSGTAVPHTVTALPAAFGDVAPRAGACGTPDAFGGNVTIGNKPLCPNQAFDTDDAFRGAVHEVRIERF